MASSNIKDNPEYENSDNLSALTGSLGTSGDSMGVLADDTTSSNINVKPQCVNRLKSADSMGVLAGGIASSNITDTPARESIPRLGKIAARLKSGDSMSVLGSNIWKSLSLSDLFGQDSVTEIPVKNVFVATQNFSKRMLGVHSPKVPESQSDAMRRLSECDEEQVDNIDDHVESRDEIKQRNSNCSSSMGRNKNSTSHDLQDGEEHDSDSVGSLGEESDSKKLPSVFRGGSFRNNKGFITFAEEEEVGALGKFGKWLQTNLADEEG